MAIARCEKLAPEGIKYDYTAYALPIGCPESTYGVPGSMAYPVILPSVIFHAVPDFVWEKSVQLEIEWNIGRGKQWNRC